MNYPNQSASNSRRLFLRDASMLAAAAVATCPSVSQGAPKRTKREAGGINEVSPIDLGVKPLATDFGGVIVRRSKLVFFTFHATSTQSFGEGMALVELSGCKASRQRCSGDEETAGHPIDLDGLSMCETYEVHNSSWIRSWVEETAADPSMKQATKKQSTDSLRHFIFTFCGFEPGVCEGGKHFECLAENINVEFISGGTYKEIFDYMKLLDAHA